MKNLTDIEWGSYGHVYYPVGEYVNISETGHDEGVRVRLDELDSLIHALQVIQRETDNVNSTSR